MTPDRTRYLRVCVCVRGGCAGTGLIRLKGAYILSGMWESGQRGAASPLAAQSTAGPPPAATDASPRGNIGAVVQHDYPGLRPPPTGFVFAVGIKSRPGRTFYKM